VVVIDPGPNNDEHRDALITALDGRRVEAILVTHCHADHSPLAAWLKNEIGAPTVGFGPHGAVDAEADEDSDVKVEESIDLEFVPDIALVDGDVAATIDGRELRAVHTPGHTSNHMCYAFEAERSLFTGDHVMGWSTTVVSPPDGDMRAYMDSLAKVATRRDAILWPTHGNPITDPQPFLTAYLAHRFEREEQVLDLVRVGVDAIDAIVKILYANVRVELHKAAGRSVLSHLVKLVDDGTVMVRGGGRPTLRASYHAA
jgi:glyoxylase-like metal-dependent hydrolase (beta-lactamase superfamily II)